MTRRLLVGLAAAVILLLGSTACGNTGTGASDDPSADASASASPSESPSEDTQPVPDCSEVWVDGAKLPAEYENCAGEDGAVVQDELVECESGQVIFVHQENFYAAQGGTITQVEDVFNNPEFKEILQVCKG